MTKKVIPKFRESNLAHAMQEDIEKNILAVREELFPSRGVWIFDAIHKEAEEIRREERKRKAAEKKERDAAERMERIEKEHEEMIAHANKSKRDKRARKLLNGYLRHYGFRWEYISPEEVEDMYTGEVYMDAILRNKGVWELRSLSGKVYTVQEALDKIITHRRKQKE